MLSCSSVAKLIEEIGDPESNRLPRPVTVAISNSSCPQPASGTSGVTSSQPTFYGQSIYFGVEGAFGSISLEVQ